MSQADNKGTKSSFFASDIMGNIGENTKSMSKIFESAAANKLNLLKGYEGIWITARRNNFFYILNKVLSIVVSMSFACLTLYFKKITMVYKDQRDTQNPDVEDNVVFNLRLIYWFMFIYYSLHGMDEMIELFSVINQLEKGALGLFFELNYFAGCVNAIHCIYFHFNYQLVPAALVTGDKYTVLEDKQSAFNHLENFITFQYIYSFFCFVMMLTVWGVYSKMNAKARGIRNISKKVEEDGDDFKASLN